MDCTHDIIERENACADGMCPLCLATENEQLKKVLGDCVRLQNTRTFPERQCAANRGRMLLEALRRGK